MSGFRSTLGILIVAAGMSSVSACHADERHRGGDGTVDIHEQGPNGHHMIFWRIEQGDFDAVVAFLNAGVDPDIRGFLDNTPAIWAGMSNAWRMVEILADAGGDLSLESRDGISVARIVRQSLELGNIRLSSPDGQAFLRVQGILRARGLL